MLDCFHQCWSLFHDLSFHKLYIEFLGYHQPRTIVPVFYPFKTSKYLEYSFVSFQGAKIRILAQLFTPSHTFTFSTQTSFNAYKREAILFETAKRAAIYLLRTKKVLFWAKHTCIIILLWLTFAFKADHNFFFSDNTVAILKKSCHFF